MLEPVFDFGYTAAAFCCHFVISHPLPMTNVAVFDAPTFTLDLLTPRLISLSLGSLAETILTTTPNPAVNYLPPYMGRMLVHMCILSLIAHDIIRKQYDKRYPPFKACWGVSNRLVASY